MATVRAIPACLLQGLEAAGLPLDAIQLVPTTDRAAVGHRVAVDADYDGIRRPLEPVVVEVAADRAEVAVLRRDLSVGTILFPVHIGGRQRVAGSTRTSSGRDL